MVGQGRHVRRWQIHRRLICKYSIYFNSVCNSDFRESNTGRFELGEDSPTAFAYFVHWLCSWEKGIGKNISDQRVGQRWPIMHATEAWILADKLMSGDFAKFAFAQFVSAVLLDADKKQRETGCALAVLFKNAMPESCLYKFALNWVTWCRHNDFQVVKEFKSKSIPRGNRVWVDPRLYKFDHWNKECSNASSSTCSHKVVGTLVPIPKQRYQWLKVAESKVRRCIEWSSSCPTHSTTIFLLEVIVVLFTVCLQC